MPFHRTLLALVSALALPSAQALTVVNVGAFTLTYDETTSLGSLSTWYAASGQQGFQWSIPSSVVVSSASGGVDSFVLPSFKVEANPGWVLTGNVSGFIGNLIFSTFGPGAAASVTVGGAVSINGAAAAPVGGALIQTLTGGNPGVFETGYFSGLQSGSVGPFSTLEFTGGLLTLSATAPANSFASITSQPQNVLKVDVAVAEVPEPGVGVLMLAGLGLVGAAARRRRPA